MNALVAEISTESALLSMNLQADYFNISQAVFEPMIENWPIKVKMSTVENYEESQSEESKENTINESTRREIVVSVDNP